MTFREKSALERVWRGLPEGARHARHQWLGVRNTGCYATHGVYEACDFGCAACYLGKRANATPPLPFEEVRAQLDAIRQYAGPGANTQITAGEVTLLPEAELVRIVRYARDIGLDPMVMTHGQRFSEEPAYLWRLMQEAGLQKVAVHVDSVQRGRRGVSKQPDEAELMGVREDFARQVREARRVTGLPLHAAHTVTVTPDNLPALPAVVDWWADRADAFRLLSLQPAALTGRTAEGAGLSDEDAVWQAVCEGLGHAPHPHTFVFGDPRCNWVSLFFVVRFGGERHIVDVARPGDEGDAAFMDELARSRFVDIKLDGLPPAEAALRLAEHLAGDPALCLRALRQCLRRAVSERRWLGRLLWAMARGRPWSIAPAAIVVHRFMDRAQLDTPEGRARLEACAFKVPVDGRMVSMCELNGSGLRDALNERSQQLYTLRAAGGR